MKPWLQPRAQRKRDHQQSRYWNPHRHRSIDGFAPEQPTRNCEENNSVNTGITNCAQPDQPRNSSEIMNHQISYVEKFEVRQAVVDAINKRLAGFMKLQGKFIQMPRHQENASCNYKDNRVIGRRGREHNRSQDSHGNHHAQYKPVQCDRLEILRYGPLVLTRTADDSEEYVEHDQRDPCSLPASHELADDHLRTRHGLGQQRKNRARFPFRWNLPGSRCNRDYKGRYPNQKQTDLLKIPNDMRLIKKIDRTKDESHQRSQDKQGIKIFAPKQLFHHQVSNSATVDPPRNERIQPGNARRGGEVS